MKRFPLLLGVAVSCVAATAMAQGEEDEPKGLVVPVEYGNVVLFQMAIPDAIALSGTGSAEINATIAGTMRRDLEIAGHFNLLDSSAFAADAHAEGMKPRFNNWFNIGAQGLIKSSYKAVDGGLEIDLRLYSVDNAKRISLPSPYDKAAVIENKPAKIRAYVNGFVNEVMRFYTKAPGFFGSRIVFVKRTDQGKELYQISPDGEDESALTHSGGSNMLPSVGGGRIFFTSFRNGGSHLFTLQGGEARPFAAYEGLNTGAVLSPDGRYVATTLSKDGNPEIYLLNPSDGSVAKRLTQAWGIDISPSWSPDSQEIAFVSDRHGSPQIWIMGRDGQNQRRVTFQGDYNQTPAWSPKGDKIAFTARDERNVFDIFTVNVADGRIERLTQNQGNNEEPTWSPDGGYIAFTSTRNGTAKLYIMTADGRVQTEISKGKGEYLTPFWAR